MIVYRGANHSSDSMISLSAQCNNINHNTLNYIVAFVALQAKSMYMHQHMIIKMYLHTEADNLGGQRVNCPSNLKVGGQSLSIFNYV